jgi:hypothetical protein
MYVKWILKQKQPSARRDLTYLYHLHHRKDMRAVNSGIYSCMNTTQIPGLTAGNFMNKLNSKDKQLETNMTTVMASVRGHSSYWSRICSDLELLDEILGPATFFITLSCAEWFWEELRSFLLKRNFDIDNITTLSTSSLCALDPVSTSMFFHFKFESFFNEIILPDNGPLGKVINDFMMFNYK